MILTFSIFLNALDNILNNYFLNHQRRALYYQGSEEIFFLPLFFCIEIVIRSFDNLIAIYPHTHHQM